MKNIFNPLECWSCRRSLDNADIMTTHQNTRNVNMLDLAGLPFVYKCPACECAMDVLPRSAMFFEVVGYHTPEVNPLLGVARKALADLERDIWAAVEPVHPPRVHVCDPDLDKAIQAAERDGQISDSEAEAVTAARNALEADRRSAEFWAMVVDNERDMDEIFRPIVFDFPMTGRVTDGVTGWLAPPFVESDIRADLDDAFDEWLRATMGAVPGADPKPLTEETLADAINRIKDLIGEPGQKIAIHPTHFGFKPGVRLVVDPDMDPDTWRLVGDELTVPPGLETLAKAMTAEGLEIAGVDPSPYLTAGDTWPPWPKDQRVNEPLPPPPWKVRHTYNVPPLVHDGWPLMASMYPDPVKSVREAELKTGWAAKLGPDILRRMREAYDPAADPDTFAGAVRRLNDAAVEFFDAIQDAAADQWFRAESNWQEFSRYPLTWMWSRKWSVIMWGLMAGIVLAVLFPPAADATVSRPATFEWSPSSGGVAVDHYEVQTKLNTGDWIDVGRTDDDTPRWTFNAAVGDTYQVRVRARAGGDATSAWSKPSVVWPVSVDLDAPGAPRRVIERLPGESSIAWKRREYWARKRTK